jgi:hypothetical protein
VDVRLASPKEDLDQCISWTLACLSQFNSHMFTM